MNLECRRNQSVAAYAARSRRLARRALMIRIASASPLLLNVYATMSTSPPADRPSRRNRDSADECSRSGPSSASGSRKTVTASSNETPCFAALASAFRGSHSNTYLVYTKLSVPLQRDADHAYGGALERTPLFRSGSVSELCHTPLKPRPNTASYGDTRISMLRESLMGTAVVGLGVRQHARAESLSKRAPSTTRTSLNFRINNLRAVSDQTIAKRPLNPTVLRCVWYSAIYEHTPN